MIFNFKSVLSHFYYMISEPELIAHLEPFMVPGSITDVTDSSNKPLIARLTSNASFLPTASIKDVESFIRILKQISSASNTLLRDVEGVLKRTTSIFVEQCIHSEQWHNNAGLFYRKDSNKNFHSSFLSLFTSKMSYYGNTDGITSAEVIFWLLSFTDLSKAFYWLGDALYPAKVQVSKHFGISKPDVFSFGLRSLSENVRNLDAHLLPSYRNSNDGSFSDKSKIAMMNPWISTKCNLGKFYGRMCFLIYITTDFGDEDSQNARRRIKCLIQQMPKMTLNYLGIPNGWLNEPLWSNI